uniref:TIL domain-containing protein n=1 Tax=Steinernema glaseri TaxID=37863 RepID=A0A1I7Y7L5_9BILA
MKLFFFFVVLALATVSASVWRADISEKHFGRRLRGPVEQDCGENEYFDSRSCSTCDPSCRDKDLASPCEDLCYPPRCLCKAGFLRDDERRCIPATECPEVGEYKNGGSDFREKGEGGYSRFFNGG